MSTPPPTTIVDLITAVDNRIKKVHTQSLDLSFNELLNMYRSDPQELNINPDFQRLFQWSEGARSRFIESLLLEMPVPPIYVIEEEEGRYLLIDGLQRISSYLHFRGELEAPHLDPPVNRGDKLVLSDCDIVSELNGKGFDDLGTALQIKLKRAFVRVEVVRRGSDPRFKYHMFKRLNTGGTLLSPQQLRNCAIRLLDPTPGNFLIDLSTDAHFRASCTDALTNERTLSAYDHELILRFFALKNCRSKFKHDVDDFLTDYMESMAQTPDNTSQFDYAAERTIFQKTFRVFDATLRERSFCYATKAGNKISSGFSVYHFEALTLGLQTVIDKVNPVDASQMTKLRETFESIKTDANFIALTTGGGKNSSGPLRSRIDFVTNRLAATV